MRRIWPLLALVAGCARSGDRGAQGAASELPPAGGAAGAPVVALRLPGHGGTIRAYTLPGLAELSWPIAGRTSPARGTIGMDVPGRRLLYRDTAGAVTAFGLVASHERTVTPRGAIAALGADGALVTADGRGAVVESRPWGSRPWPDTVGPGVAEIFPASGNRLLVVRTGHGDSLLSISRDGGVAFGVALPPAADREASRDGDALALATDSGIVVIEERDPQHPWFVRLAGTARAVGFSPSGHRLYVALRDRSELAVLDRYARSERDAIPLPGPAQDLRVDPWGRAILLRPTGAEGQAGETWVVGVARNRVIGRLETEWDTDLPTVAPNGVILDREGDVVVARDVHTLDSLGAVEDAAGDYWFAGAWAPAGATAALRQQVRLADTVRQRRADPPRATSAPPAPGPRAAPTSGGRIWVQVSASQSEPASRTLVAQLSGAGYPVQLVTPQADGDVWRVVMGPYASRGEAEAAGRALGRPFFIVDRPSPSAARP